MKKFLYFFAKFVDIMKNIVYTKSVLLYSYNGGLYNDIFEIDFFGRISNYSLYK